MHIRRMTPTIGAENTGIDLTQPASDTDSATIGKAWLADPIYKHRWRAGDVAMWNNALIMHRRDPFPGHFTRQLQRVGFRYPPAQRLPV